MCFTKSTALSYLSDEATGWVSGSEKTQLVAALNVINSETDEKLLTEALLNINNLFWDSSQITNQSCFGQALYTLSETVDPNRPMPEVRV